MVSSTALQLAGKSNSAIFFIVIWKISVNEILPEPRAQARNTEKSSPPPSSNKTQNNLLLFFGRTVTFFLLFSPLSPFQKGRIRGILLPNKKSPREERGGFFKPASFPRSPPRSYPVEAGVLTFPR